MPPPRDRTERVLQAIINIVGIDDDGTLAAVANQLLEAVITNNRYLMRRFPGRIKPLYTCGVRFRAEPWANMPPPPDDMPPGFRPLPPVEQFCAIPTLIHRGFGDCAQLCAWRVAELREDGEEDAALRYYVRSDKPPGTPDRRRWYHVEVRRGARGDRAIEDPSRRLDF